MKAKHYRYGGVVVRVHEGTLTAVRVGGSLVRAAKGQFPRAAMSYAPLPKRYREQIAAEGARLDADRKDRERRARLAEQGVELPGQPKRAPWVDLGAGATGALA